MTPEQFRKSCFFRDFGVNFHSHCRLKCDHAFNEGCFAPPPVQEHRGHNVVQWCEAPLLGAEIWKKWGDRKSVQKTRFSGILTSLTHSSEFLITIFEFFGKNAADWCRRCIEIRISDMEHFAPKFRIWPFWVDKLLKIKSLKKLQNMVVGRPGCSESAPEWFLETNNSWNIFKKVVFLRLLSDFFGRNSHAPMLSRLPLRGASHLLLCKEHRGPNVNKLKIILFRCDVSVFGVVFDIARHSIGIKIQRKVWYYIILGSFVYWQILCWYKQLNQLLKSR